MKRLLLLCSALLLAGGCWSLIDTVQAARPGSWLPALDSTHRYVLGKRGVVLGTAPGTCAVFLTLLRGGVYPTHPASRCHDVELAAAAQTLGIGGAWSADRQQAERWLLPLSWGVVAEVSLPARHFIVLLARKDGYVYAADPTTGHVLYTDESFQQVWTGRAFRVEHLPFS